MDRDDLARRLYSALRAAQPPASQSRWATWDEFLANPLLTEVEEWRAVADAALRLCEKDVDARTAHALLLIDARLERLQGLIERQRMDPSKQLTPGMMTP